MHFCIAFFFVIKVIKHGVVKSLQIMTSFAKMVVSLLYFFHPFTHSFSTRLHIPFPSVSILFPSVYTFLFHPFTFLFHPFPLIFHLFTFMFNPFTYLITFRFFEFHQIMMKILRFNAEDTDSDILDPVRFLWKRNLNRQARGNISLIYNNSKRTLSSWLTWNMNLSSRATI